MLVIDTNIWLYVATATEYPVEIYSEERSRVISFYDDFSAEMETPRSETIVSPYIASEVADNIHTSERAKQHPKSVKSLLESLLEIWWTARGITAEFSPNEIGEPCLETERRESKNELLATLLGIQVKDVPIFMLAYEHPELVTILTNDREFASFDPREFNLFGVTIDEIDLNWSPK